MRFGLRYGTGTGRVSSSTQFSTRICVVWVGALIEARSRHMGQKQRPSVAVITRSSTWWDFKLPTVLFVFYLLLGTMEFDLFGTVLLLAVVVVVVASAASCGHVVNDISDVESDRVAGKQNAMADSSPTRRGAFLVLFGLTGFTPLLLARAEPISYLLLAAIYVSVTLYSIPPIRTKERGVLGPKAAMREVDIKADPPRIVVSTEPAVLVLIQGDPILQAIPGNDMKFVVNTNWDLFVFEETATPSDQVDRNTYELFDLEPGVPTDAYELETAVAITRKCLAPGLRELLADPADGPLLVVTLDEAPFSSVHAGGPEELFAGKGRVIEGIFKKLETLRSGLLADVG